MFVVVDRILEDGVSGGGLMPDAIPFQVGTRWVVPLSLLFLVDNVEFWT